MYRRSVRSSTTALTDELTDIWDAIRRLRSNVGAIVVENVVEGPQGEQGEQGEQGVQGATGPAGPAGPAGPSGAGSFIEIAKWGVD